MPSHETPHFVSPNFDPLARIYRWMEYLSFGPMLERCRFRFVTQCRDAQNALILGDGDGRFTARLVSIHANIQIDAVDASTAMLAQLRGRVDRVSPQASQQVRTVHDDLRRFSPAGTDYDLVASHFFLDCLTDDEVEDLIERISPCLTPRARWLVSEFAIPRAGLWRICGRWLIRFLYFAFAKMTHLQVQQLPDYASALARHGFQRREQAHFLRGLLVAEIWERNIVGLFE